MNKIVTEHIRASEVPSHLRDGIDPSALVTVTVQEESASTRPPPDRAELKALIERARKSASGITTEEAVSRIRSLRDEWDD
jgi:hypothetical protein